MQTKTAALILLTILLCTLSHAQENDTATDPAREIMDRVNDVVCMIIQLLQYAASGIAALVIMLAGLRYVASGEDPQERDKSKKTITYAFIGLALVIIACPAVDYLVTGTNITPFSNSCNCLAFPSGGGNASATTTSTTNAGCFWTEESCDNFCLQRCDELEYCRLNLDDCLCEFECSTSSTLAQTTTTQAATSSTVSTTSTTRSGQTTSSTTRPPIPTTSSTSRTTTTSTTTTTQLASTDVAICQNAQNGDVCDWLDIGYGTGYKSACCSEHAFCC